MTIEFNEGNSNANVNGNDSANANADDFFQRLGSEVGQARNRHSASMVGGIPIAMPCAGSVVDNGPIGTNPAQCWAQSDEWFYGIAASHPQLPAAVYRCVHHDRLGPCLERITVRSDLILSLPDSITSAIVNDIRAFRGRRSAFTSMGFLHKRGILIWGPPGSGKTSTVSRLCDLIVEEEGGVAVYASHPQLTADCLRLVRRIEPERPLIVVFEDLDALVDQYGETEYLALLDGQSQIDNVVSVATTNYPERLDPRFVNRPGRFARIEYVGMPSEAARRFYVETKVKSDPVLVEDLVRASRGLSIDHLREMIVLVQCDGMPVAEAEYRMRQMHVAKPSSDRAPGAPTAGFSPWELNQ